MTLRANIRAMKGYTPGEQLNDPGIIKLNTNENPYPPSPRVVEAIQRALTANNLRKYPQPLGDQFRQAAAAVLGVDPEAILVGNGSDDLLTILTRAFVPEGGLIASPTPSYILYQSLAEIQGARFQTLRFEADWSRFAEIPAAADITFLPNPNSPSGTVVAPEFLAQLVQKLEPRPLVLDEAYADFADSNGLHQGWSNTPNVILTRSFSKSYALAGIRFGFAIARPVWIREFIKVKDSYNCDVLSLAAATAAIQDQAYFQEIRAKIIATRERCAVQLRALGWDVTPSQANFLWCRRPDRDLKTIYEELKRRKILVRYMSYPVGPTGHDDSPYTGLRISVGTDEEMDRLLAELKAIV